MYMVLLLMVMVCVVAVVLPLLLVGLVLQGFDPSLVSSHDLHARDRLRRQLRRAPELLEVVVALQGDDCRILTEILQAILHVSDDATRAGH